MSNFEKSLKKYSLQIFEVLVIDDVGVINHFVQFHFLYSLKSWDFQGSKRVFILEWSTRAIYGESLLTTAVCAGFRAARIDLPGYLIHSLAPIAQELVTGKVVFTLEKIARRKNS